MEGSFISPIAHIKTDFNEKFGIPRQAGRVDCLSGKIIFEKKYRNPDAIRRLEDFSHIWLIFDFSLSHSDNSSLLVRPPRLGGNTKVGVFASRSPFRPNSLGLSCVKLEKIEKTENDGNIIIVSGVDLLNNTPIFDIKPYLPSSDCIKDAYGGYAETFYDYRLDVDFPNELLVLLPENKRQTAVKCLADDPRPSYQQDDKKTYSMLFSGYDIHFTVNNGIIHVFSVEKVNTI